MHGNHLKSMLLAMAGVFVLLLLVGVPPGQAVVYAASLACPLMMITMMAGHGDQHGTSGDHERRREPTDAGADERHVRR